MHISKKIALFVVSGALLAACGGGGGGCEVSSAPATGDVSFTITFNSNGGSAVSSQTVKYGAKATRPSNPTKLGNTFVDWYVDEALKVTFDFDQEITADWTLYAAWENGEPATSTPSGDTSTSVTSEATSEPSHEAPTEDGYYIVISGARYVKMTGGDPWDMDPSYTQWAALNVHVEEGEHISFYHVESGSGAGWATMKIDQASKGTWTQEDDGILCGETNNYDMYVKLKYQQDNIYFGYAA